jgi:hypothetical protein
MKPIRIKLQRTKGWRMPPNTVKVDRSTRWGNPVKVSKDMSAKDAVVVFSEWLMLMDSKKREKYLAPLRGKNLACWCKLDQPCHADVLLWLANQ